jgi:hypothetical protein
MNPPKGGGFKPESLKINRKNLEFRYAQANILEFSKNFY